MENKDKYSLEGLNLEPQNKQQFEGLNLEEDKPDLTFSRFFQFIPEGLRRFGRAQATAARSHTQWMQRKEERLLPEIKDADPAAVRNIMERFPGSFRLNPDMAAAVQERVDRGQDKDLATWEVVQDHYMEKQARFVNRLQRIEESKLLESPREFRGRSSGWIEDAGVSIWSSMPSTLATMTSPVLGVPVIYAHMQGAMQEQIEKASEQYGIEVSPDRIFAASSRSAMINTPMELVGNLFKIRGMMGSGKWGARLGHLAEAFSGETLTEFAQNWPEEVALRWVLNPDLDHITLTDHIADTLTDPEAWKGAAYDAFIGGISGVVTAAAGQVVIGGLERLIHPKQRAINEARVDRVKEIIKKPIDEMGQDEKLDLLSMVGLDQEKIQAEKEQSEIDEIVGRVKGRLLFQAAPIESTDRDKLMDSLGGKVTTNQANQMLSIWDGMARVAADEGLIDTPADFYKQWISQIKQSKQEDIEGPGQGDSRGAVQYLFDNTPKIIHLFEKADASTLIHETGHILNEMLFRAGSTDYLEAAKWAGVDEERALQGTQEWSTEELEKFAKGFELYMMEGRAPTMRLHSVFQRLKTFLLDIYRKVSNKYFDGIELNTDIRSLFDRWVASEYERSTDPFYEVSEWYAVESLAMSDQDLVSRAQADPGTMTDLEYDQLVSEARRRVAERKEQRKKKLYGKLRKAFKQQAVDIIEADPFYEMLRSIESGRLGGISIKSLKDLYDQAYINDILAKRPGLFRRDGMAADVVANEWGYDTTDDFIQALLNRPSKKDSIELAYNDLWAEFEQTEHLEHASDYEEALDIEIDLLNEMLGKKKPAARRDLKKIIREQTGQVSRQVPDSRRLREDLHRDARVARKAWNEAVKITREIEKAKADEKRKTQLEAARTKKIESIIKLREQHKEKVSQLKQAFSANKKREKIFRRINRKIRQKNMLPEYRSQITNFLSRYINIPQSLKGELPQATLDQFVASKIEEGENLDTILALMEVAPEPRLSGQQLSLTEVETIGDIVDALSHMEINERKQRLINEKETIQRAADDMIDSIIKTYPTPDPVEGPLGIKKLSWFQSLGESARRFFAELRKVDFIVRALDGFKNFGPNYQHIMEPMKKAEDSKLEMGAEYLNKLKDVWAGFDRSWAQKRYQVEGIPGTLTKEQMIMVALNSGNLGNRAALIHGNGFTEKQIADTIGKLTQKEQKLILKTWDLLDSLFPELNKVHRKLTGVRLRKVEGKYFPLKFDARESWKVEGFRAKQELRDLFANQFIWARVDAGHRIERKGGKLPVRLDFGVIHDHIEKTVHDITHQIPIRNVQKLLHNEQFRNTVRGWVGPEIYAQFTPWLSHIANPNPIDPDGFWGKLPVRLRKNSTIVALGLKISVAMKQALSLTQTMDEIGFTATMRGIAEFYKNPARVLEIKRGVDQLSSAMRFRGKSWDRELQAMYRKFDPGARQWTEQMKDGFFAMIQAVDALATYPTWLGAYHKAMDGGVNEIESGDHKKAIEYADLVVRTTQPAANPKDIAAIQRGSNWKKLITMFYTFFSVFQNRIMEVNTKVRLGKMNAGQVVGTYFYLVVAPAVLGLAINERGVPDWDDVLKAIFQYRLAGIPFVRDLATGMVSDYGYTMSPVQAVGERISRAADAIVEAVSGDPDARRLLRETTYAAGYAVGLPSSQMVIAIDGAFDLAEGRTKNPLRLIVREKKKK